MKKHVLFILLSLASLAGFAQTQTVLPAGAKPYGNQLYIDTQGRIWSGTGSAKFRVIDTKQRVDSLLAVQQIDINSKENFSNKVQNFNNPSSTIDYPSTKAVADYLLQTGAVTNIKNYGAVGDSSTNNTTAIRAAIAAMIASGNRTLYIPKGIYLISDTLNISVPCTIIGEGGQEFFDKPSLSYFGGVSKIVQTAANKNAFSVTAPAVTFDRVAIATNSVNPTAGSAIAFYNGNSSRVENCSFFNFYINVNYENALEFTMKDCYFRNPVKYNLLLQDIAVPDGGDASFVGNYFYSGSHPNITQVFYKSGGGAKFVNNKFNAGGPNYKNGIVVAGGLASTSILLLTNNSLENYTGTGVKIIPTTDFLNISVQGNQFSGLNGADTAIVVNSTHAINGYIGGNIFYNTNIGIYKNAGSNYSIGNNNTSGAITPYLLPGAVNDYGIVGNQTVGQTKGQHSMTVYGGNTATSDGSAVSFYNGLNYIGGIGNYSALKGGTYDSRFTLFPQSGLTYSIGDFTASGNILGGNLTASGLLSANKNVSSLAFTEGLANITPSLALMSTATGGKAVGLLVGGNSAGLVFDGAGPLIIGRQTRSDFPAGLGNPTNDIVVSTSGAVTFSNAVTAAPAQTTNQLMTLGQLGFIFNKQLSGTGATTQLVFAHGFANISSTSVILVQAKNAASAGITFASVDATNIYINYSVAPVTGTNNLSYSIYLKP